MDGLINALSKGYDPAARESQLNQLQMQRNELAAYPEDRAYTLEERNRMRRGEELLGKERGLKFLSDILDASTLESHDQIRDTLERSELGPPGFWKSVIPDASSFGGDPNKFKAWKDATKTALTGHQKPTKLGPGEGLVDPMTGQPIGPRVPMTEEKGQSDYGKIAQDMFGMSYSKLDPEQKKQVDDAISEKRGEEKAPEELRKFEIETGISSKLRGTKEYQETINKWRQGKKEAIQITSPFEQGKYAASLRKEFEDLRPVKDYRDLVAKFGVMKEAYKESQTTKNFVATDQALITLFNKMTDPQSVVRESEYARTPADLALMNRLKGKIEKLSKGGPGLTQEDRKALLTMGEKFFDTYTDIYKNELRRYRGYAGMAGLDPNYVAEEFKVPSGKASESKKKTITLKSGKVIEVEE